MGVKSCFFHEVMLFLWRRTTLLIILHKCPVILDAGFFGVLVPHKAIELRVVCGWFFVLCFFVGWCFFFYSGTEHVLETFNEAFLLSFVMDLQEGFYFFILFGANVQCIYATTLRGTGLILLECIRSL